MKNCHISCGLGVIGLVLAVTLGQAQELPQPTTVADQPQQKYFLIDHSGGEPPAAGFKLLLVMPGGDGSADFHPFVSRIGEFAAGKEYLLAQLVAVKWTPDQRIVWPTENSKVKQMEFSTEDFLRAVIRDIGTTRQLDAEHIYTLSWSSSGPAAYAASLAVPEIDGSFVAMSVFKPAELPPLSKAKGHRYYIYHSPDDRVCPLRMAQDAQQKLAKNEAAAKMVTYQGGHGWRGDVFGEIRNGLSWLESRERE
jgi:predicted esterase